MTEMDLSFSICLLKRVSSYPVVQRACSSARSYYCSAKGNSILRYGLETAETKICEISAPVLKKLEDPMYRRYINDVDSFGCRQLDYLESQISRVNQYYFDSILTVKPIQAVTSFALKEDALRWLKDFLFRMGVLSEDNPSRVVSDLLEVLKQTSLEKIYSKYNQLHEILSLSTLTLQNIYSLYDLLAFVIKHKNSELPAFSESQEEFELEAPQEKDEENGLRAIPPSEEIRVEDLELLLSFSLCRIF
eukprot:TRINITY_DN73_c0_g1_i1.p1 TRINITY_DN73_c0_g1~~TRINITY_DN73_c0_g1_i1.p1  ORF type:complete len:248 (-),score=36.93 TRINITY_DN73_c0_g1_i1:129-872(-)